MSEQVSTKLAFIFYRQIQIAIAINVIKLKPPNMSIEEYAKEFQRQYRKNSKHYNLNLERSILTNQLLQVVSKQNNRLDLDNSFLALREECRFAIFKPLTSGSYDYVQRLHYVSRLFEAGLETEILFNKKEEVTHMDIYRILSTLDFSNTLNPTLNSYLKFCSGHTMTSVAVQILKDSIETADFEYLFTSCIKDIFKIFKTYLNKLSEAKKDSEQMTMLIKKCNNMIVKCFERNSCHSDYEKVVVNSVQELIRIIFDCKRNKYERNMERFCYLVIRKWKNHRLVCVNSLNVFVYLIKAYTYGENGMHLNSIQEIDNCRRLLTYTKAYLNAYCQKYLVRSNTSLSDSGESQLTFPEKNIQFYPLTKSEKQHFYLWSRTLATFSIKINDSHFELAKLAWQCIKIILLVGENKSFRKQYKDFIETGL